MVGELLAMIPSDAARVAGDDPLHAWGLSKRHRVQGMLERQVLPIDENEIASHARAMGLMAMWDRARQWSEPR